MKILALNLFAQLSVVDSASSFHKQEVAVVSHGDAEGRSKNESPMMMCTMTLASLQPEYSVHEPEDVKPGSYLQVDNSTLLPRAV